VFEQLQKTRDLLLGLCADLPRERAEQKAASVADSVAASAAWSAAEVVEHLALVERFTTLAIKRSLSQPTADAEAVQSTAKLDSLIRNGVPQRTIKVNAPDPVQPSGKFGPWPAALESFLEFRDRSLELAKSDPAELEARIIPHAILGPMTLRQWLEFIAAHTERHCLQIEEQLSNVG
jgi:hypothetical protein